MNRPLSLLICDDEVLARQRIRTLLAELSPHLPTQVLGEASHGREALQGVNHWHPDVILLDIHMPAMDGMEVARQLNSLSKQGADMPAIIFLTAHDEFALSAFDVQATDYLLKPVRAERLLAALQRVSQRLHKSEGDASSSPASKEMGLSARTHLPVSERGNITLVPLEEVIYFRAEMKYVNVRTRERTYVVEESLNNLEHQWGDLFLRIHRNALVARHAIVGLEKVPQTEGSEYRILLRDIPDTLPVSRRQWGAVREIVRSVL